MLEGEPDQTDLHYGAVNPGNVWDGENVMQQLRVAPKSRSDSTATAEFSSNGFLSAAIVCVLMLQLATGCGVKSAPTPVQTAPVPTLPPTLVLSGPTQLRAGDAATFSVVTTGLRDPMRGDVKRKTLPCSPVRGSCSPCIQPSVGGASEALG